MTESPMPEWTALFDAHLRKLLDGLDRSGFLEQFGWVEEMSARALAALSPESLASTPPESIYATLDSINVPGCQVRMTNLGRVNQASDVIEGIQKLLSAPGDFAVKYRAGKIPQAGIVTLTQILSLARPHRFIIRNAAFTRALAKVVPLYSVRALGELGYEEFLDICRELAKVVEAELKTLGLADWAREYRFLLLYALLVRE